MLRPLFRLLALVAALLALTGCVSAPPAAVRTMRTDAPPAPDPRVLAAERRLADLTLEQRVASLFMLHAPGTDPAAVGAFVAAHAPGGVIVMGDNVPGDESGLTALTGAMQTDPGLPLLVGVDQEGGPVRRIRSDPSPGARELRSADPAATRDAFAERSRVLAALGINTNFGIVADVTADASSFIWSRTLGDDPAGAASRVVAAVEGEDGVLSTLKHFPGHGVTTENSHTTVPQSPMGYDEWRAGIAQPFAAGIDAGAELVMMGHLRFDAVAPEPASLSPEWHRILREELGFDGIVVTDDLRMLEDSGDPQYSSTSENAIRALGAGATLVLYIGPADPAALVADVAAAVRAGRLPEGLIDDAARRLLLARLQLAG
jgi:beta-N-acetylhexosaminidase